MVTAQPSWIPQSNKKIKAMQCGEDHDEKAQLFQEHEESSLTYRDKGE
jgi:hypothetical protein